MIVGYMAEITIGIEKGEQLCIIVMSLYNH